MKILTSKKTGLSHTISEEDYAKMLKEGRIIKRFDVTDTRMRASMPEDAPIEIKKIIKKTKE
jgi:hypothetical protein